MERIEQIPSEKLANVIKASSKVTELTKEAEQAVLQARLADLEFRVEIQQVYLNNGLSAQCVLNIHTGKVKWPEPEVTEVAPVVTETPKKVRAYRKRAQAEV